MIAREDYARAVDSREPLGSDRLLLHAAPAPYLGAEEEPEEPRIPLSQYLWILRRYRARIAGFVTASVLTTWLVSARVTPVYESTATVDIDRQTPSGVVGEDATPVALNDADQFLATQMKLVESDSVLRPVDERLGLRRAEHQATAAASELGEQAPVTLKRLRVTRPPSTYLMQISYRSEDPHLAAEAANAIAQSYLEHTYNIRIHTSASLSAFMEKQLEELKAKMERSSQALARFERDLNVLNPEQKTSILSSRLQQLNADYTAAQSERLKQEAAYDSVREGSLDAALATPQGEPLRKLAERLNEARENLAGVESFYGSRHPEYRRAQAKLDDIQASFDATRASIVRRAEAEFGESKHREEMAQQAVSAAKSEFDEMNARSFEYLAAKREADADKTLYDELMRRIKEASINAGFQNSAIRIADPARPSLSAVSPDIPLNVLLALFSSTLLAMGAAVISDMLDQTIRDPEQIARTLHADVVGSLPAMKDRRDLREAMKGPASGVESDLSGFNESVRTLRNSILLGNFDQRYRSLLITSAAPGDGKTTTAASLASAHAEHGKRTLLIDADLRRPSVHRAFNLPGITGLSSALTGELHWRDACLRVDGAPNLDVLPAGPPSRRAGDLMGGGLTELLEEASAEYDLVVLDAPPLLGFAEPLQMATVADGVLVVAHAGKTSRKAVAAVLATLTRLRARTVGLVLNRVSRDLSESYAYYGHYRSYYRRGGGIAGEASV